MDRTRRWGITLPLHGLSLPEQRELVTALPVLGYTDAWSAELNGVDAFTPLTLASPVGAAAAAGHGHRRDLHPGARRAGGQRGHAGQRWRPAGS